MTRGFCCLPLLVIAVWAAAAPGQVAPYNPYADAQDSPPPLAADGTIHWGTFYKSAKLQQSYERLWNLGACRGSNKAITVPVAENQLVIDRLPEAEFKGVVRAVVGQAAGGMVAFDESDTTGGHAEPLVAQFPPGRSDPVSNRRAGAGVHPDDRNGCQAPRGSRWQGACCRASFQLRDRHAARGLRS